VDVVAVCDVDAAHLDVARTEASQKTPECKGHRDYRRLLDDKSIDAVVISTPDHWHALPMIHACQAGKDVYCEKPLSLTIAEGKAMVAAAREHGRIVQTGSQQRSDGNFRRACELVRSGCLGKVQTVRVAIANVNFKLAPIPDCPPPPELDYAFWLGPAPLRPYNPHRVHYNFRFFWDYSGGQLTNWGAHHLDIAQWGLGTDDTGPLTIEAEARYHKDGWYEVPEWCEVVYKYANGATVICGQSERGGATFEGENGSISVDRKMLSSKPEALIDSAKPEAEVQLYRSDDHHLNWLDCIRSRELPICDVEIGHRSATVCHLGNIAIRSRSRVQWEPSKQEILGDAKLAAMAARPYRLPWSLPKT
jgi:predicted dehydrogenase